MGKAGKFYIIRYTLVSSVVYGFMCPVKSCTATGCDRLQHEIVRCNIPKEAFCKENYGFLPSANSTAQKPLNTEPRTLQLLTGICSSEQAGLLRSLFLTALLSAIFQVISLSIADWSCLFFWRFKINLIMNCEPLQKIGTQPVPFNVPFKSEVL